MVTGRNSYTSLERVSELQRLAADQTQPASVRERATAELEGIDAGGSITAAHQRTRVELSLAELDQIAADTSLAAAVRARATQDAASLRAAEALTRVRGDKKRGKRTRPALAPVTPAGIMTVRAFVLTWDELAGWWERADPDEVGPALTEEQWHRFEQTVAGTVAFAEAAEAARRHDRHGELRTA